MVYVDADDIPAEIGIVTAPSSFPTDLPVRWWYYVKFPLANRVVLCKTRDITKIGECEL